MIVKILGYRVDFMQIQLLGYSGNEVIFESGHNLVLRTTGDRKTWRVFRHRFGDRIQKCGLLLLIDTFVQGIIDDNEEHGSGMRMTGG